VIKAMNVATRSTAQFVLEQFNRDGPSVSLSGTIAYMTEDELNDAVTIHLHQLNGQFISRFTYTERLTIPASGAKISPDDRRVAFALNRNDPTRGREDAVYVCNASGAPNCNFSFNLRDPAWMGNDKLVAVTGNDRARIFTIEAATGRVAQVGGTSSERISNPAPTPDGQHIIFARDSSENWQQ
jgi:hypothetical protein